MTDHVQTRIANRIGFILLDRPKALNSLSLEMVRALTAVLRDWRDDGQVDAVVLHSSSDKALCAGGDIRFFHDVGTKTPTGSSALLEDFFTEEYALNHLIHFYPKPYVALMDGVVMGGGMGIAQAGEQARVRVVTERTKMAMPEVNIGLFPDVGGGYFLSRAPGRIGRYLGLTGEIVNAHDALYAGLADVYVPSADLPALVARLEQGGDVRAIVASFAQTGDPAAGVLAQERAAIDRHFGAAGVPAIMASLAADDSAFAMKTLAVMRKRSPLLMCVTFEQLERSAGMDVADCLRMERTMVRRNFEHGEVLEGVRALVIDKDNAPRWAHAGVADVTAQDVARFFEPAWPAWAHPLRELA
jgi:enoyl-CoA hydratase/carnithine racemase